MNRRISTSAAMAVAVIAVLTGMAGPAQANPAVRSSVTEILRRNPGAHQTDATTVVTRQGVIFSAVSSGCPSDYLCLYSGTSGTGTMLKFYYCRFVDIGKIWGVDRIRSIRNNQASGTRSDFYNYLASSNSFTPVGYSVGVSYHPTVTPGIQTADGVRVC